MRPSNIVVMELTETVPSTAAPSISPKFQSVKLPANRKKKVTKFQMLDEEKPDLISKN